MHTRLLPTLLAYVLLSIPAIAGSVLILRTIQIERYGKFALIGGSIIALALCLVIEFIFFFGIFMIIGAIKNRKK